jgi:hypothetical protein
MVGSVCWTAQEILQLRQILFGWKPIFVLDMWRSRIRLFTFICEKEFSILSVQTGASSLLLKILKIKYCCLKFLH